MSDTVVNEKGNPFRSLRHRNVRVYFIGLLLSNVGTWMQFTATSLLIYSINNRATDAGLNTLFQFLPMPSTRLKAERIHAILTAFSRNTKSQLPAKRA